MVDLLSGKKVSLWSDMWRSLVRTLVSWHNRTLYDCFQMGLDEDVIRFSIRGLFTKAKSINLILWLKGSNFVVEVKNYLHPVPS